MNLKKGQLWVIEGTDGSGKQTQAKMLVERLNTSGILGDRTAHLWAFPTYEDPVWGKLLKEYLSGEYKADEVDPKYASLLYAADRGKAAGKFVPLMEEGDWIICDRYAQSNMAHQGAKIIDVSRREEFLTWLENLEFNYFGIPKPTGVFFLSLPVEVVARRMEERLKEAIAKNEIIGDKVKKRDVHEQDQDHLNRARQEYYRLAKKQNWQVIECVEDKKELTREEIADKIWKIVLDMVK